LKKNDSIELEFEETYEELIEKEIELLQWAGEKLQWNLMVHA
jgi:hypothetical protein